MKIRKQKRNSFKLILFFIITIVIVAIFKLWPETKAEEIIPANVTVEFSSGEKEGVFENVTKTIETNQTSGYITLPTEFAGTVSVKEDFYFEKVDNETFYFTEGDYSYTFTGWKIKNTTEIKPGETVFQPGDKIEAKTLLTYDDNGDGIVEFEALWGKVIYAQNAYTTVYYTDYWMLDLETTQTYEKTGAWNYKLDDNNNVTLNDGKDVNNPICTLDYAYYLIYQMDYNNGFANANSHNAYEYVIMLTGDLDYVKTNSSGTRQENFFTVYDIYDGTYDESKHYIFGEYTAQINTWGYVIAYNDKGTLNTTTSSGNARRYSPSVSFKSCTKNTTGIYNLYINGFGYSDGVYSSLRIDNVNFAKTPNTKRPNQSSPVSQSSETTFYGRESCFLEFTRRSDAGGFVLRPSALQTAVINGGTFVSWQTTWSSSQTSSDYNYEIHWYMGENAKISGAINLGTTANYADTKVNFSQDIYFTMTGGVAGQIYGTCNGMNSTTTGKRKITIIGDKGSSTTSNPQVTSVYGGGNNGPYYGDTNILIKGSTNIGHVYGGGYYFTATTYGNTNVTIIDSKISGNVFGGGYNGNVEKDSSGNGGNVNLNIENSEIKGNIFGSGMGGSQTITITASKSANQSTIDWQNTTFVPDDSFFSTVKNEANGDYNTDWSWDKPASGFPFLQDGTNYICTAIYKGITWTGNGAANLTFQRIYTYVYLSKAIVENDVTITIDGSTIGTKGDTKKGNVYGGGSVAVVGGNTYVTVKNNSTIYGNIYGGGDGATEPGEVEAYYPMPEEGYTAPTYTVNKQANGTITVSVSSENKTYSKYKYAETFKWSNDEALLEKGGIDTENHLIYTPNLSQLGIVNGNTSVVIENSIVEQNVYAGGNAADVLGETSIVVTNSSAKDIFGGAYSGNVGKNTSITINSGNIENVFGGGDLGVVNGNTQIIIGNSNNPNINIASLLYGGGRGVDADNDGDASDFTTVMGTATVTIEGINTYVENYGSSTIGAVQGQIDVTFKNYKTGNVTNEYKTMNGIDRATNVYFENSYVLLTNRDESGNLIGIKSIENLYIPKGSGLKVSAPGEISGNFEGGGELYLDSEICLTIGGNITGSTTLVLNPLMYADTYIIKGGKDNPYMKVAGEIPEDAFEVMPDTAYALVSGDSRYEILYEKASDYTKYYIHQDITISQTIAETILLKEGKQYSVDTQTWQTGNINILQNYSITANVELNYQYKEDDDLGNKYQNIERGIIIRSGEEKIDIPKNTVIIMVIENNGQNEYYTYKATENIEKVKLSDFSKLEDLTQKYSETKDITSVATGDSLTNIYSYNEKFQFILDFSECENLLVANKTYNILLEELDNNSAIDELAYTATNTMNLHTMREINYNGETDRTTYSNADSIILNGSLVANAIEDSTIYYSDENKNIKMEILLKNAQGQYIQIPNGTTVSINNTKYEVKQDTVVHNFIDITRNEINEQLNIEVNMKNVIEKNRLSAGTYSVEVKTYVASNGKIEKEVGSKELTFMIVNGENYGIKAQFISETENADKIQLFKTSGKTLQISVDNGDLQNANVQIELQQRVSPFTYSKIENSVTVSEISNTELQGTNTITVNNNLEPGTYRIVVNLYDGNGIKFAEDRVNFIVKE